MNLNKYGVVFCFALHTLKVHLQFFYISNLFYDSDNSRCTLLHLASESSIGVRTSN